MYNICFWWRVKMFTVKTEESALLHLNLVPQRGQEELFSTFSGLLFILTSLLCLALRTIYWFIICGWKFTVRTTNTWQLAVLGFLWRWTLKTSSAKSLRYIAFDYQLQAEKWVATSSLTCNIESIEFLFVAVAPRGIADCRSYFNRSSLLCSCCQKTTSVLQ